MPTHLSLEEHLAALVRSGAALREAAARAGLDAPVPTCPQWDVRALVTHQGMVHRWATAHLRHERDHRTGDSTAGAAAAPDLLDWFSAGLDALVETIRATPDDARSPVFLNDAPPPRRFWARRQAHETTIHAADAVGAALKVWPAATEVPVSAAVAADGIDELLCGFITRGGGKLRSPEPLTVVVATDDTGHAWTVRIGESPVETTAGTDADADATFTGPAVALYLGLWNRGDDITVRGRDGVLPLWRERVRVRWGG